ncbi:hypothetical protein [Labilithrix luteola]|uniref:hypothetical protein n=1 Tax=Labilithrix luteola TaxID=1391654 RepID=UPI0011BA5B89|nr:hypothetical protein [Labilithrix luteola]
MSVRRSSPPKSRLRTGILACTLAAMPIAGCGDLVGADFDGWNTTAHRSEGTSDGGQDPGSDDPSTDETGEEPGSGTSSDGGKGTGAKDGGPSKDAGQDSSSGPNDPGSCQGTVTSCETLEDKSSCLRQTGCSWSTPVCRLTFNCTSIKTNVACQSTAGCATDFTTSTCQPATGYCVGSTRSQCESASGCALFGGCSGTATACEDITDDVACSQQVGCQWP